VEEVSDTERIWKPVNGDGYFIVPTRDHPDFPRQGETWTLEFQGGMNRYWKLVNDGHSNYFGNFYFVESCSHPPTITPQIGERWKLVSKERHQITWEAYRDMWRSTVQIIRNSTRTGVGLVKGKEYRLADFRLANEHMVYVWQDDKDGRIAGECVPRQLAMAGPLHHKDVRQLFLEVRIKGQIIRALINCGAEGNFIHPKLVKTLQLSTRIKDEKYPLYTINDAPINDNDGLVEIETRPTLMTTTSGHAKEITFDVVRTAHPIVLGIP
jgi:hypothetical protein